MQACKYYQGKHARFCPNQDPKDPACTVNRGDYYGLGRPAGCYRKAVELEKLAKKHRGLLKIIFHK